VFLAVTLLQTLNVPDVKRKLGRTISRLRKEKGLTQESLAEKTDYSVDFIGLIERGVNAPSVDGLERIAKALNVSLKRLFEFDSRT
jgi:transcriptional regulator with XRE-family HTH domain